MYAQSENHGKATLIAIQVALLPLLAAILFGLFSLIMPYHSWTVWRLPVLLTAGGLVALLIVLPFRQPLRSGILDGLAVTLSLASAVSGLAIALLIAYGLSLQISDNRYPVHSLMFQLTNPGLLGQLLIIALVPVVPGVIGLWLAKRRVTARTSLAAMAARSSMLGLIVSGLILCAVVVAAAYHWVEWP